MLWLKRSCENLSGFDSPQLKLRGASQFSQRYFLSEQGRVPWEYPSVFPRTMTMLWLKRSCENLSGFDSPQLRLNFFPYFVQKHSLMFHISLFTFTIVCGILLWRLCKLSFYRLLSESFSDSLTLFALWESLQQDPDTIDFFSFDKPTFRTIR